MKRPRSETFSGFGLHQRASAKLIVSVPDKTDVVARSGDGSIRIEQVAGRLDLEPATAASAPRTSAAS